MLETNDGYYQSYISFNSFIQFNIILDTFTAGVKSAFEVNIESAFINVNNADGSSDSVVALASVSIA